MLSADLTSSGLGTGTSVEGSGGGLTAGCCRAAGGAGEVCSAEVKLKSESAAAKVRRLNIMEHPHLIGGTQRLYTSNSKKQFRTSELRRDSWPGTNTLAAGIGRNTKEERA